MKSLELFLCTSLMIAAFIFCLSLGVNLGIANSNEIGPRAACEQLRFPLIDCDKMWDVK